MLFCLLDDAYGPLNPQRRATWEDLKSLSDSEVITLALFQQLRGVESEHSFLRDAARFLRTSSRTSSASIPPPLTAGCASSGAS